MNLCSKADVLEMVAGGRLTICPSQSSLPDLFLDDIRIGLPLGTRAVEIREAIDVGAPQPVNPVLHEVAGLTLRPRGLYLIASEVRISLGRDIFGLVNTRSKFARLGLSLASSSIFVIPGFGSREPAPIVFEIAPTVEIKGVEPGGVYAYLILFRLDQDFEMQPQKSYSRRFPLDLFIRCAPDIVRAAVNC
jgi:deoxycytidine triphosphate deaminase